MPETSKQFNKELIMPKLQFNTRADHVSMVMKSVQFIDIETSLNQAYVFRTGKQSVNANQLTTTTKILTVAGGTMYDLYTKGKKSVWGISNHHFEETFKKDPHDDTKLLEKMWDILDEADVVVAHNGRFDEGWLRGRFLELGWKQPSRFSLICTYQGLRKYNMTSKKLDELSQNLIGTKKITTDFNLWLRCAKGEVKAFEEMLKYNKGDIYDTMFKVYMRTCQYYPQKSVDMTDHSLETPQCRVTGHLLEKMDELYTKHTTGKQYYQYINPKNGIVYVDRYCVQSKKADKGKIRHHE